MGGSAVGGVISTSGAETFSRGIGGAAIIEDGQMRDWRLQLDVPIESVMRAGARDRAMGEWMESRVVNGRWLSNFGRLP